MFFIVAIDIVSILMTSGLSVTPAYSFSCRKTTDFELFSKVQIILELLFVRDGYFTFNNFTSYTVSDMINSLIDNICTG